MGFEPLEAGDTVGALEWEYYEGGSENRGYGRCAEIVTYVGPSPGVGDTPGNIRIRTTPEGSTTPETAIAIASYGWVGIGTVDLASHCFEVGQGLGNMIADGYDVHSRSEYKTDIRDLTEADLRDLLERFKRLKLYQYKRVPFVSADELKRATIKRFGEARWTRIYLNDEAHRGGALRYCPDPEVKAFLDETGDRLRAERALLPEWQREYLGLIADEETAELFPSLVCRNKWGEIVGICLSEQVGLLHAVIFALVTLYPQLEAEVETIEAQLEGMTT